MEKVSLAVVGATGIVGQEILSLLAADTFEAGRIQLCASDDSVGEFYDFGGTELEVVSVDNLNFSQPTLVLLCAPRDISESLIDSLREKSLAVIDCSGVDRDAKKIPLMPDALAPSTKAAAFSVRSAAGFMVSSFLNSLEISSRISSLAATALEPVSGAGRSGLDELWNQTRSIFNQVPTDPEFFPEQIAFNLLPQVDVMGADGISAYEKRVVSELKASGFNSEDISVTALRVPVMYGTGVSLSFKTSQKLSIDEICEVVAKSPRFSVDQKEEYATSTMSSIGDDTIHLSRVRVQELKKDKEFLISCWLVADNIKACIARPVVDLYRSLMPAS